jgi:phosphoribosylformimino-5-aminoimidazole carboxamide ribotide isomerase
MIIFPAIDLRRGRCVRLRQGRFEEETVFSDDPVAMAHHWIEQGASWLHIVNLDGALGQDSLNARIMAQIVSVGNVPVQFGGGLRDMDTIEIALSLGPARIILGTVAVRRPQLVAQAIRLFGAESIVVGIDALEGKVATHGWRQVSSVSALELARQMADLGVQRVVHTDIDRDGTLGGVNVQACVEMARASGLKVIASGGVGGPEDIRRLAAVHKHGIEGVIVGQALYTGALSLPQAIGLAREDAPDAPVVPGKEE